MAVEEDDRLGYRLHRQKFGHRYLFVEYDWDEGPPFGTAIPLALLRADPPLDEAELLVWLAQQEDDHRGEIDAAWDTLLGPGTR